MAYQDGRSAASRLVTQINMDYEPGAWCSKTHWLFVGKKVVKIPQFNIYFNIIQADFFVINSNVLLLLVPCKELQRGKESREEKLTITLRGSVLHSVFGKNNSLKCRCLYSNPTSHPEKNTTVADLLRQPGHSLMLKNVTPSTTTILRIHRFLFCRWPFPSTLELVASQHIQDGVSSNTTCDPEKNVLLLNGCNYRGMELNFPKSWQRVKWLYG